MDECRHQKKHMRVSFNTKGLSNTMIFRVYVTVLGGGFKDFSFSPLPGEMIQSD